jgi:hypothetical protein
MFLVLYEWGAKPGKAQRVEARWRRGARASRAAGSAGAALS